MAMEGFDIRQRCDIVRFWSLGAALISHPYKRRVVLLIFLVVTDGHITCFTRDNGVGGKGL